MESLKLKIKGSGLSVIEILIVISLCLILLIFGTTAFLRLRDTQALGASSEEVISSIYDARAKTLSSKRATQYGVHLQNDRVVVFEGAVYDAASSSNRVQVFSGLVEIYSIVLNGGGADIVFDRLTGKTNQFGNISLRVKNNTSLDKTVEVNSAGIIR